MYPKFIETHRGKNCLISVNIESIELIDEQGIRITGMDSNRIISVLETYDELKEMIQGAGCLIAKRDPRLDYDTPLTMEDLKRMIGEPVWDSNHRCWYLVWMVEEYPTVRLRGKDGILTTMDAEDIKKFPLYRMKRSEAADDHEIWQ